MFHGPGVSAEVHHEQQHAVDQERIKELVDECKRLEKELAGARLLAQRLS